MIWITQWLCPNRHANIALAWDDQTTTAQQVEEEGEALYNKEVFNRWCGICHGELHVEHGRTKYKTMEEAEPALKEVEQLNLAARNILSSN